MENTSYFDIIELVLALTKSYEIDGIFDEYSESGLVQLLLPYFKFASGEFDMVIQDKTKKQCEIFEIKHSKQMVSTQYRHINNEEKIVLTEAQFGKVVRKCVLYRGESQVLENGVEYKNVEEFLKGLR